jgi:hypothetical protein
MIAFVRALGLGAVLLSFTITESLAAVRISGDRGGRIGSYIEAFSALRNSGEKVVIDGPCLSACTLILGILSANQVCVTSRARFGFHAAWHHDDNGRLIDSSSGTQILMRVYPSKVRNWIRRKGGLSRKMIYLKNPELSAFYPRCQESL